MARPAKKPNFNSEEMMKELIKQVTCSFGAPYDDRLEYTKDHVSLRDVAKEYNITILKARKILITSGAFSTNTSRTVQRLYREGLRISKIMEKTGLSRASVHSYIPYTKLIYNMSEISVDADRKKHQRERQHLCKAFMGNLPYLSEEVAEQQLWTVMEAHQGCVFYTARNLRFRYTIKGGELFADRKQDSITKATVFMAFHKALAMNGNVAGPKKLGTFGASYLYPIFQRIGIIRTMEEGNERR